MRAESGGPYAVAFRAYEHAKFVAVLRGHFLLQREGEPAPAQLRRGDCYVLTCGNPYRIFNAEVPDSDAAEIFSSQRGIDGVVRWGNAATDTVTVGSRITFSREGLTWLRGRLPPFIRIPAGTAEAARFRALLALLHADPPHALGGAFAADRYVGILLLQALRHLHGGKRQH